MVWYGMVWYGMIWYGMVWYGMVWYGMVWYGLVWYGTVWYGMVWYGICRYVVKVLNVPPSPQHPGLLRMAEAAIDSFLVSFRLRRPKGIHERQEADGQRRATPPSLPRSLHPNPYSGVTSTAHNFFSSSIAVTA